jgi:hypothetical protein
MRENLDAVGMPQVREIPQLTKSSAAARPVPAAVAALIGHGHPDLGCSQCAEFDNRAVPSGAPNSSPVELGDSGEVKKNAILGIWDAREADRCGAS